MIIESALHNSFITRSEKELIILKQDALHQAARYPVGSLRRRHYLGVVDRIAAILAHQYRQRPPAMEMRL